MEACTVETGLLRKTPCGHAAVAKCANCEQPLCSKHAIAQLNEAQKKTGKFMCADCYAADRQYQATTPAAPQPAKVAAPAKPPVATAAPAARPAAPSSPAAAKPPAGKPAEKPLEENSDGSIDFTPSKK